MRRKLMKRVPFVLAVLVIAAGGLAIGWWWVQAGPQERRLAFDLGLTASRSASDAQGTNSQVASGSQGLAASGTIEGEEIAIVAEIGGRIVRVHVGEGDMVEAGGVLVELDTRSLTSQLAQAEAAVAAAEANLAQVKAGAPPAQVLMARAARDQAIAEQSAAEIAWQDSLAVRSDPQEIDAQIVAARAALKLAEAHIEEAESEVAGAEAVRDRFGARGSLEEKGMYVVHDYQVKAAQAGLEAAKAERKAAAEKLEALKALKARPLAILSQVHQAEAQYRVAAAGVAAAEAKLAEVEAGPTAEQLAVAEAQVLKARALLAVLEAQIDKMTLKAPMAGLVAGQVARAGEVANAGAVLLALTDLDEVEVILYVPETKLGGVQLGQMAEVTVDAFPERVFSGAVSYLSQKAEFTPQNVQTEQDRTGMVFAVKVRVPNPEHMLRPGMPADVVLLEGR
jgi:HlyD family secretion protein